MQGDDDRKIALPAAWVFSVCNDTDFQRGKKVFAFTELFWKMTLFFCLYVEDCYNYAIKAFRCGLV